MTSITALRQGTVESIWQNMEDVVLGAQSVEEASTHFLDGIYNELSGSLALARTFLTVPLADLTRIRREFAQAISSDIDDGTSILSLLATRGSEHA